MTSNFALDKDQENIRDETALFAQKNLNSNVVIRNREGTFDADLWRLCGEEGIQGLAVSATYDGKGYSALQTSLALEGLGYGCEDGGLAFALAAQMLSCAIPLSQYGSTGQKENYLREMCRGRLIATNAMTEAESGSAAFQMQSRAERVGSRFHLSGEKSYCANAPVSDLCVAYVLTDPEKGFFGGVSAFLLDRKRHAYTVADEIDKLGLRSCSTGKIRIDNVIVDDTALIGPPGGGGVIFNKSMDWERVGMSAMNVGTMTRILERATAYAKKRKPGGLAISKHQAISHNLEIGRAS